MSAWLTLAAGPALLTICLFLSVAGIQDDIRSLIREAETLRRFNPTCTPCNKEWVKILDEAEQTVPPSRPH